MQVIAIRVLEANRWREGMSSLSSVRHEMGLILNAPVSWMVWMGRKGSTELEVGRGWIDWTGWRLVGWDRGWTGWRLDGVA